MKYFQNDLCTADEPKNYLYIYSLYAPKRNFFLYLHLTDIYIHHFYSVNFNMKYLSVNGNTISKLYFVVRQAPSETPIGV